MTETVRPLRFFVDFDGTVASSDVVDVVLERFASREWQDVEREWAEGKIGSRECLRRQLGLVRALEGELWKLVDGIGVDAAFEDFLKAAAEAAVPVSVVSDGFEPFIRRILERAVTDKTLLKSLKIFSNSLAVEEGKLVPAFAGDGSCGHACANCKPAVMRRESGPRDYVVFVGDGLSDRFAAREADLVFAKKKLLDYCRAERLRHRPYAGFDEIAGWLRTFKKSANAFETLHHLS